MSITQCWTVTQHVARRLLHPVRHLRRHVTGHAAGHSAAGHALPKSPATLVRLVCRKLPDALGPAGKAALVGGAAMTLPPGATPPPVAPVSMERGAPVLTPDNLVPPLANTSPSIVTERVLIPPGHPPITDTTKIPPTVPPHGPTIPEPSSRTILAAGLLGLWGASWRLRLSAFTVRRLRAGPAQRPGP